jgi:hypothetical protein
MFLPADKSFGAISRPRDSRTPKLESHDEQAAPLSAPLSRARDCLTASGAVRIESARSGSWVARLIRH